MKKKEDITNCNYSTTAIAQPINLLSHLIDVLSKHMNFISKVFDIRALKKIYITVIYRSSKEIEQA